MKQNFVLPKTIYLSSSSRRFFYPTLAVALLSIGILILPGLVEAQSGRRLPNQKTQPAAPPLSKGAEKAEPEKDSAEAKKGQENKAAGGIPVLITYFTHNPTAPQYYTELVVRSCADRFQKSGMTQTTVGRDMNRKEASDFAKNSKDVFVVFLQLETDSTASGNLGNSTYQDPRNLQIDYTVFEPQTGKSKTSGRTYPRSTTTDPLSLPQGRGAGEYQLKRAAEDAADRILRYLGQQQPPPSK